MLVRLLYASRAVDTSPEAIESILNQARQHNPEMGITGILCYGGGIFLQAIEGGRVDIDRLLRRLLVDPRHSGLRILVDTPITTRSLTEPMALCAEPAALLEKLGLHCLSGITANEAEAMLEYRTAA